MPTPIDFLRQLWQGANTPVIPQETIQPWQDALDHPTLDRSPMEASLRGFGAGAMEGVREQLTPFNLMAASVPLASKLASVGGRAVGSGVESGAALAGLRKAAPTIDLIEPANIKQVMPSMSDVDALTGDMQRNLAKIAGRNRPPIQTAGERFPDFTPKGGEYMYNAGRDLQTPYGQGSLDYILPNPKFGGTGK